MDQAPAKAQTDRNCSTISIDLKQKQHFDDKIKVDVSKTKMRHGHVSVGLLSNLILQDACEQYSKKESQLTH